MWAACQVARYRCFEALICDFISARDGTRVNDVYAMCTSINPGDGVDHFTCELRLTQRVHPVGLWKNLARSWRHDCRAAPLVRPGFTESTGERQTRFERPVTQDAKKDASSSQSCCTISRNVAWGGERMFVSDKCLGLVEWRCEFYPGGHLPHIA